MKKSVGNRYEETKDLDIAEIAKMIRQEFSALKKSGDVASHFKLSVRISRYSMGRSIDSTLTWDPAQAIDFTHGDFASEEVLRVQRSVEALIDSFNYDNSQSEVDYFDVRFYGHVRIDFQLRISVGAQLKERFGVDYQKMQRWPIDVVRVLQDAYLEGIVNPSLGLIIADGLAKRTQAA